jgi:hypothetical protein
LAGEWLGFGHFVSLNPKMEIAAKERKDRKEKESRTQALIFVHGVLLRLFIPVSRFSRLHFSPRCLGALIETANEPCRAVMSL